MAERTKKIEKQSNTSTLMPVAVDVDLVRFEKNLLQIGFFGANDTRDKSRTSRRIEQIVIRDGQKIKVAAEFRGSESLGLPSTTDRDKFIALLKIISEERDRTGAIANPIRFSGYRLITELGIARNGENYEEISRWGKRMTDTTITSEKTVFRAAKKVYSDETLHVFRSFKRTGSSNLQGSDRQEHYEVVLEDWLLENLNQRYVVPEDFNAYKQLTRPTAKGIFGNLHLWFHASQGRAVEKDYSELCNLLNVQAYPHLSKIKSTMGLALNELVKIKYISKWDVQKMSSKLGYKIVLTPGQELQRILDNSRTERRQATQLLEAPPANSVSEPTSKEHRQAIKMLLEHAIVPAKAESLVARYGAEEVIDKLEYLEKHVLHRKNVDNPAGLIIYSFENSQPVPSTFTSSRKRRAAEAVKRQTEQEESERILAESTYQIWLESEQDKLVTSRFPDQELGKKLDELATRLAREDDRIRRMAVKARKEIAYSVLRKEMAQDVEFPSFDDWRKIHHQMPLFTEIR
jgi:hypothetical protein